MPRTITRTVYSYKEMLELNKKGEVPNSVIEDIKSKLHHWQTDDDFWFEDSLDTWKSALRQIGFEEPDISFSGFWCQGDGASFTAKSVEMETLINFMSHKFEPKDCIDVMKGTNGEKEDFRNWLVHHAKGVVWNPAFKKLLRITDFLSAHVERIDRHYSHWNTCRFRLDYDDYNFLGSGRQRKPPKYTNMIAELVDGFRENCEQLRKDVSNGIYHYLEKVYYSYGEDECIEEFAEANDYTFLKSGKPERE